MCTVTSKNKLPEQILADTWWYGLTDRMSLKDFRRLAERRQKEGFNAIQLVMGIPPEVEISSSQAYGGGKPAFSVDGSTVSDEYIKSAVEKLKILHKHKLTPIIYGAWGHQIDKIGVDNMTNWWRLVVSKTEEYKPVYCLTGEIDFWQNDPTIIHKLLNRIYGRRLLIKRRINNWLTVYNKLKTFTDRPIICHVTPYITSDNVSKSFAAITIQTGHSYDSKQLIWSLPLKFNKRKKPFINLEPWYEGICDGFWEKDQLFAFWSSMLAGAAGYCFGQHGVWNMGDGRFLAHWGRRTFKEAMRSDTAAKLGKSNKLFWCARNKLKGEIQYTINKSPGFSISMSDSSGRCITFLENAKENVRGVKGITYNPSTCCFEDKNEISERQAVEFSGFSAVERRELESIVEN